MDDTKMQITKKEFDELYEITDTTPEDLPGTKAVEDKSEIKEDKNMSMSEEELEHDKQLEDTLGWDIEE